MASAGNPLKRLAYVRHPCAGAAIWVCVTSVRNLGRLRVDDLRQPAHRSPYVQTMTPA